MNATTVCVEATLPSTSNAGPINDALQQFGRSPPLLEQEGMVASRWFR